MINVGEAMWNQREQLATVKDRFKQFADIVIPLEGLAIIAEESPKLYSMVLEYQPDLVVEVGRRYGNTTFALVEAANQLENTSIVSICLTDFWHKETVPHISAMLTPQWGDKLDARVMNLFDVDVPALFAGKKRILFLLDAHGWDVAEFVLANVLPELADKEHIVLFHDIVPAIKLDPVPPYYPTFDYNNQGIWFQDYNLSPNIQRYIIINGLAGAYAEFLALIDFSERNNLTISSVERDIRQYFEENPERHEELNAILGDVLNSPLSMFVGFSLSEIADKSTLTYPAFQGAKPDPTPDLLTQVLRIDMARMNNNGKPSIRTFILILLKLLVGRYNPYIKS